MNQKLDDNKSLAAHDFIFSSRDPALQLPFESAFARSLGVTMTKNALHLEVGRGRASVLWKDIGRQHYSTYYASTSNAPNLFGVDFRHFAGRESWWIKVEKLRQNIFAAVTEIKSECAKIIGDLGDVGSENSNKQVLFASLNRFLECLPPLADVEKPCFFYQFTLNHFVFNLNSMARSCLSYQENAVLLHQFFTARDRFVSQMEKSQVQKFDSKEYSLFVQSFCNLMFSPSFWGSGMRLALESSTWMGDSSLKNFLHGRRTWPTRLMSLEKKAFALVESVEQLRFNLRKTECVDVVRANVEKELRSVFESQPLLTLLCSGIFEIKRTADLVQKFLVCLGIEVMATRFVHKSSGNFPFDGYLALARMNAYALQGNTKFDDSENQQDDKVDQEIEARVPSEKANYMSMSPEELAQELCAL